MTEKRKQGHNLMAGQPDGDLGRQIGAPLGWKALVAKHGIKKANSKTRQWSLDNPSSLERKVMAALDNLGVKYLREYIVCTAPRYVRVDFKVKYRPIVIEADGAVVHGKLNPNDAERQAWREKLIAENGYHLVRLPERVILNGCLSETLKKELGL